VAQSRGISSRVLPECPRLLLLRGLPNPLVEPVHDVALLAGAVMRVVVASDLDRGVARLLGGVEQVIGPCERSSLIWARWRTTE
jgi:hypothetical protein